MINRVIYTSLCLLFLLFSSPVWAQLPIPARIGGTLTVNGTPLTENTDTGYRIEVTRPDGSPFTPAAEDVDGLTNTGWYIINIPLYHEDQPGGANPGETALIRVFKEGSPLEVTEPSAGTITVGNTGSTTRIDLAATGGAAPQNHPPEARITGPTAPVQPGENVVLEGSASTDPDPDETLTYTWRQTDGTLVDLATEASRAAFTAPASGPLTFELRVRDKAGATDTASITVQIAAATTNQPPVAQAGPDRTVAYGERVILDGSASSDPDGTIAAYQWKQVEGKIQVQLETPDEAQAAFTASNSEVGGEALVFSLTVTDDKGLAHTDTVTIDVTQPDENMAPVAKAGHTMTAKGGETVRLDGSNSGDSDPGDWIVQYAWNQISGPPVSLSAPDSVQPTFVAPEAGPEGTALTFELTVTDNHGLKDKDTVTVNITSDVINLPPVAEAGAIQKVSQGEAVLLDASGSTDADGSIVAYRWEQVSGQPVELSQPDSPTPTFTAPAVTGESGAIIFLLTVTDNGGLKDTDSVVINITGANQPPNAVVPESLQAIEGESLALDGSAATDTDGEIDGYFWQQTQGPSVTLSDPFSVSPTFVLPRVGPGGDDLLFELTITDDSGLQDTAEVHVQVADNGIQNFPQENILSFRTETGHPMGIRAADGNLVSLKSIPPGAGGNPPGSLPFGRIDVEIKVSDPGETSILLIYLPEPLPQSDHWYLYSPSSGWSSFNGEVTANENRDLFQLPLTDGGKGDLDRVADRIITAFIAPVKTETQEPPAPEPEPERGGDGDTNNCFIGHMASSSFTTNFSANFSTSAGWFFHSFGFIMGLLLVVLRRSS